MTAVAYIRRSAKDESEVSESTQRETVQRLASEHGDTLSRVYRDWGRSGGSETRPEYLAMLAEAAAGNVGTIYSYDQDRLARSDFLFASLLRLADLHGFSVYTPAGDLTDENKRTEFEIRGVLDGNELRKMKKRNKAIARKRSKRGDDNGAPPFGYKRVKAKKPTVSAGHPAYSYWHEDKGRVEVPARPPQDVKAGAFVFVKTDPEGIAHVIEAYKAAGTYLGTAHALNAEGFATKRGKGWHAVTVSDLIHREAPELVADVTQGRRREPQPRLFRGLLRCHCGGMMSPGATKNRNPEQSHRYYYCGRGQRGAHPGPHGISESKLLPWVQAEAARLRLPSEVEVEGERTDTGDARQRLETARDLIGEDAYTDAVAKLDEQDAAGSEHARAVQAVPPSLDWTWSTEAINAWLRAAFEYIELGPDLLPVRAEWLVPEWRHEG